MSRDSYFTILDDNNRHGSAQLQEGLNVDTSPFLPAIARMDSLYYYSLHNLADFLGSVDENRTNIASVEIPADAQVFHHHGRSRANKMIVHAIRPIREFDYWNDPAWCLQAVQRNPQLIKFVRNQTISICQAVLQQDGNLLQHIRKQTPELCLLAVKQNGLAIAMVREQTLELCREAVKQNGAAIQYIVDQTTELCLDSVSQNGLNLQYVRLQTDEICRRAILQNPLCLQYVRDKTPQLCMLALRKNKHSSSFREKSTCCWCF